MTKDMTTLLSVAIHSLATLIITARHRQRIASTAMWLLYDANQILLSLLHTISIDSHALLRDYEVYMQFATKSLRIIVIFVRIILVLCTRSRSFCDQSWAIMSVERGKPSIFGCHRSVLLCWRYWWSNSSMLLLLVCVFFFLLLLFLPRVPDLCFNLNEWNELTYRLWMDGHTLVGWSLDDYITHRDIRTSHTHTHIYMYGGDTLMTASIHAEPV